MDGNYCLGVTAVGRFAHKVVPEKSEYYAAFLYRPTSSSASCSVIGFRNGNTILGWVRFYTGLPLRVYRAVGTDNLLATGSAILTHNTTYFIEVRFKPHGTGVFQ